MKAKIVKIDASNPDTQLIKEASNIINTGGLVAFPTETVYGLGADAFNEKSIKKIFVAKGRPSDNPLIVHISHIEQVHNLAFVNDFFYCLINKFWPGPLTIILKKKSAVLDIVSANLDTVAVRMPSNKIALALIESSKCPIVAPSANTSGKPSPTNSQHVVDDLYNNVDIIIDGGKSTFGIESTVIDLSGEQPLILRPGSISLEQIQKFLPNTLYYKSNSTNEVPKSPGMKYTHYSPDADVLLLEGNLSDIVNKINQLYDEYSTDGKKIGILCTDQTIDSYFCPHKLSLGNRNNLESIASNLFDYLRKLDKIGVDIILTESINYDGIGVAIMNRIIKAAGFNILKV